MHSSSLTLTELIDRCERTATFWIRLAAALVDRTWQVQLFDAVSATPPPSWTSAEWQYPTIRFIALELAGAELAAALRDGSLEIDGSRFALPELGTGTLIARRFSSRQRYVWEPLEWPSELIEFGSTPTQMQVQEPLVSGTAPSFLTFAHAAAPFFGLGAVGTANVSGSRPVIRFQDMSGRIASYSVQPAIVEVVVEGNRLDGAVLELAGPTPGPTLALPPAREDSSVIAFALESPLAPESWLVLKHDSDLLDERILVSAFGAVEQSAGFAADPVSTIRTLVAGGETSTVEFKSVIAQDREERRKLARTIAAFANGDGGRLLFGVTDLGEVRGVRPEDATPFARDTLTRWVSDIVSPLPEFTVEAVPMDDAHGQTVVVVAVAPGSAPPYGIEPAKLTYWIRRGATTFAASVDEVRRLVRRGDASNAPPSGYPRLR